MVCQRIRLLVRQEVHELQLDAYVVQPLLVRYLQAEGTEKAADVAKLLGLLEDVAGGVERLAGRAV